VTLFPYTTLFRSNMEILQDSLYCSNEKCELHTRGRDLAEIGYAHVRDEYANPPKEKHIK
jgi:hypothetical protein